VSADLVIFDCDGVLVDSEAITIEVESQLLTHAGFAISADEIAERYVGLSYASMMAGLEAQFGRPVPDGLSDQIQTEVLAAFPQQLEPVAGVADLLAGLDRPRCVASSSDLDRVEFSLHITELALHFEPSSLFSAQMVDNGKPAPDLFLHAAATLGVDSAACIVVEDSPHGVTAALAAGMEVVGLVAGGHARPSLRDRLHAAGAPHVAETTTDLAELLAR